MKFIKSNNSNSPNKLKATFLFASSKFNKMKMKMKRKIKINNLSCMHGCSISWNPGSCFKHKGQLGNRL